MRCSFRNQSSTATKNNSIASNTLTKSWAWVAQKTETVTLLMLLGLGSGWIAVAGIAPQVAQADSQRVEISLDRQQNETYQNLVGRAETTASTIIQRSFDQDILMKKVSVMIMGQNHGAIAPVLFLAVNRDQWSNEPNVQRWVTYFRSARSLLGFENVTTTAQPTTSTPDTSEQPQTPAASGATNTNRTPANSGATPANTQKPTTATTTTPGQTPSTAPNALNPSPVAPTTNSNPVPLGGTVNGTNIPNNSGIIPNNNGVIPNNSGIIPDSNPLDVPTTPNGTPDPQPNPPGFNDSVPQGTLD